MSISGLTIYFLKQYKKCDSLYVCWVTVQHFTFYHSLRPRASSSSSQPDRCVSPLVASSTHSLEAMPRVALSTDDEGQDFMTNG